MFEPSTGGSIEVVRGRMTDERADQIRAFWSRQGALDAGTAEERLQQVVCVLLDSDGEIAGVNSVYRAELPLIGGRPFLVYRSLLPASTPEAAAMLIMVAFNALEAEYDPSVDEPLGLCVLVKDPAVIGGSREAQWIWPWLTYAGHLDDGSQVRIRYFGGAHVNRPAPVESRDPRIDRRYRIELLAEQTKVDTDTVIDLWTSENVLPREEAERRVHEVLLIATDQQRELAAVCTAYLQRNDQLGLDMWHLRTYTALAHRMSGVATLLTLVARDHLQVRYISGLDTRGSGIVLEVENEFLKERFDDVIWYPLYALYIGDNERGDHVRAAFFAGARVPEFTS